MHSSALANQYVKDPRDAIKVKVQKVGVKHRSIALSTRLGNSSKGHAQQQPTSHVPVSKRENNR